MLRTSSYFLSQILTMFFFVSIFLHPFMSLALYHIQCLPSVDASPSCRTSGPQPRFQRALKVVVLFFSGFLNHTSSLSRLHPLPSVPICYKPLVFHLIRPCMPFVSFLLPRPWPILSPILSLLSYHVPVSCPAPDLLSHRPFTSNAWSGGR